MSTNSSAQLVWKFVCHTHPVGRLYQEVSKNVLSRSSSSASFLPVSRLNEVDVNRNLRSFSKSQSCGICSSNLVILKRTLKIYPGSCSKGVDDGDDDKDKDKKSTVKTESPEEELGYDPKKDSFFTQDTAFGSKENKGLGEAERPVFVPDHQEEDGEIKVTSGEDLSPPTTCCQSGCPNCVWIEYVERLSKFYTDPSLSKERIMKELDGIEDSNIKAFIMMELRVKKLI